MSTWAPVLVGLAAVTALAAAAWAHLAFWTRRYTRPFTPDEWLTVETTDGVRLDQPPRRRLKVGDLHAFLFQLSASVEHRRVLDGGRDQVASLARRGSERSEEGQIVALCAAADQNQVFC